MSLRFFGRQQVTEQEKAPPADKVPSATRAAERSRTSGAARRAARARKARTQQPAKPAPIETPEPTPAAAPSRGRRQRRPPAGEAPPKKPAPEAPAPPTVEVSGLESLLAQQGRLLEDFASKQLTVMRSVQRSLSAVEKRLGARPEQVEEKLPLPRVGIFVDVPNVMYAAERQGLAIDYARLLSFLSRGRELVRASAYAPISDDPQVKIESQRFVQPFVDRGYRIVTKPLKRYADGSIKANFDVELAIDILTMSDRLDIVSLVSGDGDFRRLVEMVASKGVRVEVVAFAQSMSHELRAIADQCVEIGEHLSELRAR